MIEQHQLIPYSGDAALVVGVTMFILQIGLFSRRSETSDLRTETKVDLARATSEIGAQITSIKTDYLSKLDFERRVDKLEMILNHIQNNLEREFSKIDDRLLDVERNQHNV